MSARNQPDQPVDVAIVGAGLAGITCGRALQQRGYEVVLVDKSRGLGGRVATRRLEGTCADHGAKFVEPQGTRTQQLIEMLGDRALLYPWHASVLTVDAAGTLAPAAAARYVAPAGMTAIAKALAADLTIQRHQRIVRLQPTTANTWQLFTEIDTAPTLTARSVVLAIPAPQAVPLLAPLVAVGLPAPILEAVQQVTFDPCVTAIATYTTAQTGAWPLVGALQPGPHPVLRWVSREDQKRQMPDQAVCVLHSTPSFAAQFLDAPGLEAAGATMLQAGAAWLPGLEQPQQVQLHRWRYGFVRSPLPPQAPPPHTKAPIPLVVTGDWCRGNNLEAALTAGEEAASTLQPLLN